ncbi:MAG: hypothetical protein QOD77_935 [Thermoplasmata archaeon]|jgi:hypothetical protein|nr:hypothetical protein [Thermoplasmata archaeon]
MPAKKATPAKGATTRVSGEGYTTASTFSPRMAAAWKELDAAVRRVFPKAEPVFDYGVRGWRVPRPLKVEAWKGTMDPNWLTLYLAERAQGITLHFWNPCEPGFLKRKGPELAPHGLKAMVGCLQFTRKGDYPVPVIEGLLREARGQMESEAPR